MGFFFFIASDCVGGRGLGEHPDVCAVEGGLRRPQQLEFREYHLFWTLLILNCSIKDIYVLLHPLKFYFILFL